MGAARRALSPLSATLRCEQRNNRGAHFLEVRGETASPLVGRRRLTSCKVGLDRALIGQMRGLPGHSVLVGFVGLLALTGLVGGCASEPLRPPPAPIATSPEDFPIVREADPRVENDVPRSIRRIVAEERVKLADVIRLTSIVDDASGRSRARSAAFELHAELRDIESALDTADSDRLDDLVERLHRLSTRVSLLHDALEAAL